MIGVIVSVYKVEPYLRRCVDSILRQTLQDFKILLIDDGSPDKCPEICDEYAASDERITVIHQKNQGIAEARNVGIDYFLKDEAIEHIAFVDSDDWLHPQYLESLHEAMKGDTEIDIAQCNFISTEDDTSAHGSIMSGEKTVMSGLEAQKLSTGIKPILWAKLYKKSVFTSGAWGGKISSRKAA
ncbi:MAG: glycosyltransferase [Lachnospiraceae bacterium]|nr:glycosyltransferase [Lachnospiraceae bacterium]